MPLGRALVILFSFTGLLFSQADTSPSPSELDSLRGQVTHLREAIQSQTTELEVLEAKLNSYVQSKEPAQLASAPQPQTSGQNVASPPIADDARITPLEISGYFSSRYTRLPSRGSDPDSQQQTLGILLDKSLANWQFHSELELEYGTDFSTLRAIGNSDSQTVGIETAWADYGVADLLHAKVGMLLFPTYWALHHYPSTSLTVQNPLIHEAIFPKNIIGGMVHGSHYFEHGGGFDYNVYGGKGFKFGNSEIPQAGNDAMGGTFLAHLPTAGLLNLFDLGVQYYRDKPFSGYRQQIYGFEAHIEKGRFQFLSELANAGIGLDNHSHHLLRNGYYLQPAWLLTKDIHAYYRYDWLKFIDVNSVYQRTDENTAGIDFRPIPTISLKLEWNAATPLSSLGNLKEGFGAGIAFFFQ